MKKYHNYKKEENEKKRFLKKYKKIKSKVVKRFKLTKKKNESAKILLFFLISALIIISIQIIFFSHSSLKYFNSYYLCDLNINKSFSYDENAKLLFLQNKILNFNKLDRCYYKINIDESKFNNIHISFAFDNNYTLLSSITIANILNISNPDTFVHFHIIVTKGFEYKNMKKLYSIKLKVNNNSEMIFYNGSRVEEDFGKHIKYEKCGTGEYAKLLVAVLIDKSIDRVINLDSGDLLVEKDLLELYNYPLDDYLVRGAIDPLARCFLGWNYYFHRVNYTNAGIYLYNLKKWREMNIYEDIVNFYKKFHFQHRLVTQHQDIINCFLPSKSIGLLPMKYNLYEYFEKNDTGLFIYNLRCSYYYKNKKAILQAQNDVVIRHYNHHKIHNGAYNKPMTLKWKEIVKLTGLYDEICEQYPKGCSKVV